MCSPGHQAAGEAVDRQEHRATRGNALGGAAAAVLIWLGSLVAFCVLVAAMLPAVKPAPSLALRAPTLAVSTTPWTLGRRPAARLGTPIEGAPVLAVYSDGRMEVDGKPVALTRRQRARLAGWMLQEAAPWERPPATKVWYGARPLRGPLP